MANGRIMISSGSCMDIAIAMMEGRSTSECEEHFADLLLFLKLIDFFLICCNKYDGAVYKRMNTG